LIENNGSSSVSFLISEFSSPSADKLRAKVGRTMVGCAAAGHSKFCRSAGLCVNEVGQIIAARVLSDLRGRGLVRQRSISADSRYSQLFIFIGAHYLATLGLVTLWSHTAKPS